MTATQKSTRRKIKKKDNESTARKQRANQFTSNQKQKEIKANEKRQRPTTTLRLKPMAQDIVPVSIPSTSFDTSTYHGSCGVFVFPGLQVIHGSPFSSYHT